MIKLKNPKLLFAIKYFFGIAEIGMNYKLNLRRLCGQQTYDDIFGHKQLLI